MNLEKVKELANEIFGDISEKISVRYTFSDVSQMNVLIVSIETKELEKCEKAGEKFSEKLDEIDFTDDKYYLNIGYKEIV